MTEPRPLQPFAPKRRSLASVARYAGLSLRNALGGPPLASFALPNLHMKVTVQARSLFARQLAKYRGYEQTNANWVLKEYGAAQAGLFVDVGANFGWYSLLMARCLRPGGTVVAIEPEPANLALLQRNLSDNSLQGQVAVLACGVGEHAATAQLSLIDPSNPGAHSLRTQAGSYGVVSIRIERLDELLRPYPGRIALLKMDIEGYEADAMLGAPDTLARTDALLMEFSPSYLRGCGRTPELLAQVLGSAGFAPHVLRPHGLQATSWEALLAQDRAQPPGAQWQTDLVLKRVS